MSKPILSQEARILHLLKSKGKATNVELNRICFRYGARLFDLRHDGYIIVSNRVKPGLWEFVYRGHVDDEEVA